MLSESMIMHISIRQNGQYIPSNARPIRFSIVIFYHPPPFPFFPFFDFLFFLLAVTLKKERYGIQQYRKGTNKTPHISVEITIPQKTNIKVHSTKHSAKQLSNRFKSKKGRGRSHIKLARGLGEKFQTKAVN